MNRMMMEKGFPFVMFVCISLIPLACCRMFPTG